MRLFRCRRHRSICSRSGLTQLLLSYFNRQEALDVTLLETTIVDDQPYAGREKYSVDHLRSEGSPWSADELQKGEKRALNLSSREEGRAHVGSLNCGQLGFAVSLIPERRGNNKVLVVLRKLIRFLLRQIWSG